MHVIIFFVLWFYLFMYPEWPRLLMPLHCPFLSTRLVSKTLIYLTFQPFDSERPDEGYSERPGEGYS